MAPISTSPKQDGHNGREVGLGMARFSLVDSFRQRTGLVGLDPKGGLMKTVSLAYDLPLG
jgi:hypothetical protein